MPQIIEYIDAIARQKHRDVLFVCFNDEARDAKNDDIGLANSNLRDVIIAWLEKNRVGWQPCGPVAHPGWMRPYEGQIYIDVPFDEHDPAYCTLRDFLEHPDGTMVHPGVGFCYYPLENAMLNAHHDAPGFWETWAEKF